MNEVIKYKRWNITVNIRRILFYLFIAMIILGYFLEKSINIFWIYFVASWVLFLGYFVLIPIYRDIFIIGYLKKKKDIIIYVLSLILFQTLLHKLLFESYIYKFMNLQSIELNKIPSLLSKYMYDFMFGVILMLLTFILYFTTFKFRLKMVEIRDRFKKEYMTYKTSKKQNRVNKYGVVIPNEK